MAPNDEMRECHDRCDAFLAEFPNGVPAAELVPNVAGDDLDAALFAVGLLHTWLSDERTALVFEARAAGRSWAWIGARLGVTRQALWERYHDREDPLPDPT